MKRIDGIYILSFIVGIVLISTLGSKELGSSSSLNRYNLISLSFRQIVYEEYFVQVVFLRFKTVLGLWGISKIIPKKMVTNLFALLMCASLGGILALAILENGIWGLLFWLCASFPHVVCYAFAYRLWENKSEVYMPEIVGKTKYVSTVLIVILVGLGCVLETYISPFLMQSIIKY